MAIEGTPPDPLILPPLPPDPRRANREDMDGISRDPHSGGIGLAKSPQKEPSSPVNRRNYGSSREREAQAEGSKGDRGLSEPPAPRDKGENPFTASSNILETIATRFNEARDSNKAGAWKQLQTDLMNASPYICPVIISYDALLSVVANIEKEIKGSAQQVGKSNEEILSNFLSGGDILQLKLDNSGRMEERDGEPPASPEQA